MADNEDKKATTAGIPIIPGSVVSFIISYAMNGFWWALLHGILGWLYVLYAVIQRPKEIIPALQKLFL